MELTSPDDWERSLQMALVSENRVFALVNACLELLKALEAHFKESVARVASGSANGGGFNFSSMVSIFYTPAPPNARFLFELDVHLELLKVHLQQLREKQFLLKYQQMALGGAWSLFKSLEKCLGFLSVKLATACSKDFAEVRLDSLAEELRATCALIQNALPLMTIVQNYPADAESVWVRTDDIDRRNPIETTQIREPSAYRTGYVYDSTLLAYARKLDVIYCAVYDSHHISLAFRHIAFSTSLMRYSASSDEAARRANDIRLGLSLEVLRGVWNIVEDPVLKFFAEKMGYFPKLRVSMDVTIPLTTPQPTSLRVISNSRQSTTAPLLAELRRNSSSSSSLNLLAESSGSASSSSSSLHASTDSSINQDKSSENVNNNGVLNSLIGWTTSVPSIISNAFTLPSTALFRAVSTAASVFSRVDSALKNQCGKFDTSAAAVLHIHGGGWVSQTAETHITYLREWARQLAIPIFSVNYSLAPESQYPVALEQCLLAYNGIRDNYAQLGFSAPPKIFLAGDSAGGNLAAALTVRLLQENMTAPAGLLLLYPALYVGMYSSLSRLTFLNDPILTYSTLMLCLHAYIPAHVGPRAWDDPLLSPGNASDDILQRFPPVQILTGDIDPLLDDSVFFARRLLKLGRTVTLRLYENLPHGFMNVADQLPNCQIAIRDSVLALERLLETACPLQQINPAAASVESSIASTVTVT